MKELNVQTRRILNVLGLVNKEGNFRIVKPETIHWGMNDEALVSEPNTEEYRKLVSDIDKIFEEGGQLIMEQLTDSDEGPFSVSYNAWILKPEHVTIFNDLFCHWDHSTEEMVDHLMSDFRIHPNMFYMDYIVKNPSHFILVFSGPE